MWRLAELSVAAVLELALLPVVLVVLRLVALFVVVRVVQRVLETALAALAETAENNGCDGHDTSCCRAHVDANVGAGAQFLPLLRRGLWGRRGRRVDVVESC